jgi:hypothetical protein
MRHASSFGLVFVLCYAPPAFSQQTMPGQAPEPVRIESVTPGRVSASFSENGEILTVEATRFNVRRGAEGTEIEVAEGPVTLSVTKDGVTSATTARGTLVWTITNEGRLMMRANLRWAR